MTDLKLSELTAVTDVQATDEIEMARAGASKKIDADDLAVGLAALVPASEGVGATLATFVLTK